MTNRVFCVALAVLWVVALLTFPPMHFDSEVLLFGLIPALAFWRVLDSLLGDSDE